MSKNTLVKTILILAANPTNTARLRLDKEVREIEEGLRRANKREQFKLEQKWAVRSRDFYRAILEHRPQIIHFCGHGTNVDGIVLEDDTGQATLVEKDALSKLFKLFAVKGVKCVVLNACYSEVQAQAISQYIKYVIGMNQTIGDKAAVAFAVAFYDALGAGETVQFAFDLGCTQLVGLKEEEIPVLKITSIHPADIQFEAGDIPPNPYLGLSAFGEKDAAFFFGREKFTAELFEMAHHQQLVAVIGASGSGKSSVVFAGLIPRLREEGIWLIESLRPKSEPFDELALALVRQLEPNLNKVERAIQVGRLAESLKKGEVKLHQVASQILENKPSKRFLLVVDQFEELYTQCQDKDEQQRFIDTLLAAVHQKSITLVFTLRADFYGYVLSYLPFCEALQQFKHTPLGLMRREDLRAAIEQPAQKLNVQLQTHLPQRILDDVGNEPGNLPLLEFALTQLWDNQKDGELTHKAYDDIGGVKLALVKHAEQVYSRLNQSQQQQAQQVFLALVRLGEATEDTRRVATQEEVGKQNWELVTHLAGSEARLVVTGRNDKTGEETVEVVHEALIREWKRLREWLSNNRDKLIQQRKIEADAIEWRDKGKSKDYLLRGKQLNEAKAFQKEQATLFRLSGLASEFIQKSIKYRWKNRLKFIGYGVTSYLVIIVSLLLYLSKTPYIFNKERFSQGERSFYLSDENYGQMMGSKNFEKKHFYDAQKFFKIASDANKNDPELLIYANNAKAWAKGNPLNLAVVIPLDKKKISTIYLLKGVALAQQEFNSNQKASRLLNIILAKDNDDPTQAEEVAQELIKDTSILGVIGHNTSVVTKNVLHKYQDAHLAIISATSSSTQLSHEEGFFRTVVSDTVIAKKLADYAIENNLKRVAIFYEENPHGTSLRDEFKKFFTKQGGKIVGKIRDLKKLHSEKSESLDYSSLVKEIESEDADAVIFCTNTDVRDIVSAIIQQARKNITNFSKRIQLLAGDGLLSENISLQEPFEGIILAPAWFEKKGNGQPKEFTTKVHQRWSGHVEWTTATSYDATKAFLKAISKSGNPDRETVLENLKSVKLDPKETSGDELNFSKAEQKQKLVIVKVVANNPRLNGEIFCYEIVKEKSHQKYILYKKDPSGN